MTAPLFAELTHNGLWYIADKEMRNVTEDSAPWR
jgi:hypothetical protein